MTPTKKGLNLNISQSGEIQPSADFVPNSNILSDNSKVDKCELEVSLGGIAVGWRPFPSPGS